MKITPSSRTFSRRKATTQRIIIAALLLLLLLVGIPNVPRYRDNRSLCLVVNQDKISNKGVCFQKCKKIINRSKNLSSRFKVHRKKMKLKERMSLSPIKRH